MEQFTKANLKALSAEINAALAVVGEKNKVALTTGNFSFSGKTFTLKIEGAAISESGEVFSQEAANFKQFASSWGLKPEHLGAEFSDSKGNRYKISGANINASQYPILAINIETKKEYKFPASAVQRALNL